jgi:glycerol uptake facilitator-like aquaporin
MVFINSTSVFTFSVGAHLNPVMSLALLVTRKISPMKALLYVTSQGGGAIAGAALLYGYITKI